MVGKIIISDIMIMVDGVKKNAKVWREREGGKSPPFLPSIILLSSVDE